MTARGQALLDMTPLWRHDDHVARAVANAAGAELELLDAQLAILEDNLHVVTADEMLSAFEYLLDVVTDTTGMTTGQRRAVSLGYMAMLSRTASRADWKAIADVLIGGGWTYIRHHPDDPGTPDPNHITIMLPFAAADARAAAAKILFERITAATVVLNIVYSDNFALDFSAMDGEDGLA